MDEIIDLEIEELISAFLYRAVEELPIASDDPAKSSRR